MLKRYHGDEVGARFEILPAIDLLRGKVVRLRQGDFERVTSFSDDPVDTALHFKEAGASWLHVVDLDGAKAGSPVQTQTIRSLIEAVGQDVGVQVAGGLRSDEAVRSAFAAGARRVVIGTAALQDPGFAAHSIDEFGTESVVIAIDVRNGLALGEGWQAGARGIPPDDAIDALADAGVQTFAVTAIDRDGQMAGPDLALLEQMVALDRGQIIASGGVSSIDDLSTIKAIGCRGAILGRAIYEGSLDLRQAIDRLR